MGKKFICSIANPGCGGEVRHLFYPDTPEGYASAEAFAQRENRPGRAVYDAINTFHENATRRCRETVGEIIRLAADIDDKDIGESVEDVVRRLQELPYPPSEINQSGHGAHVVYELKEPIPATGEEADKARALRTRLTEWLCADASIDRDEALLRRPGTTNSKVPDQPVECKVVFRSGNKYDLMDIADILDDYGTRPLLTLKEKPEKTNGQSKGEWTGPVDIEAGLASLTYESKETGINKTVPSVISAMLLRGYTPDDVQARVTASIMEAGERAGKSWDRASEEKQTTTRITSAMQMLEKSHQWGERGLTPPFLPAELLGPWAKTIAEGRRPRLSRNGHGWHVRGYDCHRDDPEVQELPPEDAPPIAPGGERRYRFRLISFADMRPGPEPLYLVDELIPTRGLVDVWGKAKCFKSFWVLDLMLHVSMGWEYRDRYVQQGAVVYCAFEGGHGYKKRIEALRRHYMIPDDADVPLHIMPGQANLIKDHRMLIGEISAQLGDVKPRAVVLDTLNKSLHGSENKDEDMGLYIRAAEAIRDVFDCVVIITHHSGHHDDTRPRGHSSLPGAVDAQLAVTRTDSCVTVTVEMMRDGPEDTAVSSIAVEIDVGQDSRGKQLTSLVMTPAEPREALSHDRKKWPRALSAFFTATTEALAKHGTPFQPEPGVLAVRAVEAGMIRKRFYQIYDEGEDNKDKVQDTMSKAFRRAFKEAQQREVVQIRRTDTEAVMVWLPERAV